MWRQVSTYEKQQPVRLDVFTRAMCSDAIEQKLARNLKTEFEF